jgi:hypothetical protein
MHGVRLNRVDRHRERLRHVAVRAADARVEFRRGASRVLRPQPAQLAYQRRVRVNTMTPQSKTAIFQELRVHLYDGSLLTSRPWSWRSRSTTAAWEN